jgi:hypothetical protein
MPTWTNVEALKLRLAITESTYDAAIDGVLSGVESVIENMIGSPVLQDVTARTEYYDGVVGQRLKLRFRPVVKASLEVFVDDDGAYGDGPGTPFDTDTEWTLGTDFDLMDVRNGYSQSGVLVCLNGLWPVTWNRKPTRLASTLVGEYGPIKVNYKAGWALADIPRGLIEAAYMEATTQFSMFISRDGSVVNGMLKSSESLNGYSYSLAPANGLDVTGYGASRLMNPGAIAMIGGLGLVDPAIV